MSTIVRTTHLSRQPLKQSPEAYWLGTIGKHEQTGLFAIGGTRETALNRDADGEPQYTARRQRFVPLPQQNRYVILEAAWEPSAPDASQGHADFPLPQSFLDIPSGFGDGGTDFVFRGELFVTRDEGIAHVARENARSFTEREDDSPMPWQLLVEVGQWLAPQMGTFTLEATGAGGMCLTTHAPFRLVIPSEAELERYAITLNGKGGAV